MAKSIPDGITPFPCPPLLERRYGVSNLKALRPEEESLLSLSKDYAPGFVYVDVKYLPQMPDQDPRTCLFAAIDRAIRLGVRKDPQGQVSNHRERFPQTFD